MPQVHWEEPPPTKVPDRKRKRAWEDEAAQLRASPGHWARIAEYEKTDYGKATNLQRTVNKGYVPAFEPSGAYEGTVRTVGDIVKVYARYVGEE